jgi:hypothetical protein
MRKMGKRFKKLKEKVFGKRKKKPKKTPAERMAKALSELPPKIHGLLANGATAPRMFLQLGFWRLAYKLKTLRVVRQGPGRVKIVASASQPRDVVRDVIELSGDTLHKLIREVADDLFKSDPAVRKRAEDLARQRRAGRGKDREHPIETGEGGPASILGRASDVATEQRGRGGFWHKLQTGSAEGLAHEGQWFSPRVGHTRVSITPADYKAMAATWATFSADPAQRVRLRALIDVEIARSRSQLVINYGAVGLAHATPGAGAGLDPRGRVTFPQALIALNPAEQKGAVRHMHEMNRRLGFPGGSPGVHASPVDETTMAILRQREMDYLVTLVYHKMNAAKLRTDSETAVRRFVKKELREVLFSTAVEAMVIGL